MIAARLSQQIRLAPRHTVACQAAGSSMTAASPCWLITGASRGLGLEFASQLLALQDQKPVVVAAVRSPDKAQHLKQLADQYAGTGQLKIVQLDAADPQSIQGAAEWVEAHVGRVDVLLNNAGIIEADGSVPWHELGLQEAHDILQTNVLGPLLVSKAMLPIMRKGGRKLIAHVSSSLGSMAATATGTQAAVTAASSRPPGAPQRNAGDGHIMYKASKAALNMEMLMMARNLAPEGFTVVSLHPGWVETDMGNASADTMQRLSGGPRVRPSLTAEKSVSGMLKVLEGLTVKDSGTFRAWDGNIVPW